MSTTTVGMPLGTSSQMAINRCLPELCRICCARRRIHATRKHIHSALLLRFVDDFNFRLDSRALLSWPYAFMRGILFPCGFKGVCVLDPDWSCCTILFPSPVFWRREQRSRYSAHYLYLYLGCKVRRTLLSCCYRYPIGLFSGKTEADEGVVCVQTGFADRRIEYETFVFPREIEALLRAHQFP